MEYAKRIRKIRNEKGFSQEYVAGKMNISQSSYSKIETRAAKCSLETLIRVAEVLGVTLIQLLDIHDEANQHRLP
jgi:transcriptional regulator with XRE-family HTH domain